MRVLAFDTATNLTSVALREIDERATAPVAASPDLPGPEQLDLCLLDSPPPGARPGHAQRLLEMVTELLKQAGMGLDGIDRLAVGSGPGTFTGLRIGIATAQALALSAGIELVGVSTLQSLALAAHDARPTRATLAVIDARRGEAFVAGWSAGSSPLTAAPAWGPSVLATEQLARLVAGIAPAAAVAAAEVPAAGTVAVGDGALKFRELLEDAGAEVPGAESPLHRVCAREHCRIAVLARPVADGRVEPQYLRLPDAELARSGG